jgi:alpha-tubulin suppressor-like RCC1 family protein
VKCWGLNSSGQLGDGTTVLRKTPVAVTGLTTVGSIALGSNHTTARLTTGAPRTWGANANGQLGSGTTSNRATAGTVVGLT